MNKKEGSWPQGSLQLAFVEGVVHGASGGYEESISYLPPWELEDVEKEAVRRYGEPMQIESAHSKVIARLEQRRQIGMQTYGKQLVPHNGRWQLKDLMEELLDAACYLQCAMDEQEVEPTELW